MDKINIWRSKKKRTQEEKENRNQIRTVIEKDSIKVTNLKRQDLPWLRENYRLRLGKTLDKMLLIF
jgi:hypothetical protein